MKKLLKFELYKLQKRKKFLKILLMVMAFQLLMAIFIKYNPDFMSYEKGIQFSFHSAVLVNVNIIFLACSIFSEDFEYLTIIPIKTKFPDVLKLVLAKMITVFIVYIASLFLTASFAMVLSMVLLKITPSFGMFTDALIYNLAMIIPVSTILLLLAIVIILTRKEKSGLILGVVIYMLYGFGTGVNFLIIRKFPIIKYGIVNLLNLSNQILEPKYAYLTQLSNMGMVFIPIIYLLIESVILYKLSKSVEI
ncbi:ABC transporter permease [Lagierella sp.]|uniref:ABC transporter permease n=1 Tax=Lagierella sp. TaxID=2849657 RepID=UPI00260F7188|nr:ABC transporter permease [Lagierella sp.]